MKSVFQGFKEFITRGNAIDLAVGVIIGAAFGAVVKGLQDFLINPIIGAIFGKPDLSQLWDITLRRSAEHGDSIISIGGLLTVILNFLIVAAAIYFVIVLPLNKLAERRNRGVEDPAPEEVSEDVLILTQIRDLLAAQGGGTTTPDPDVDPSAPRV